MALQFLRLSSAPSKLTVAWVRSIPTTRAVCESAQPLPERQSSGANDRLLITPEILAKFSVDFNVTDLT